MTDLKFKLTFGRLHKITPGVREIVLLENAGDWTIKALERHVQSQSFHLLVGYSNGKPVVMASLKIMDGLSRVDDVVTYQDYRNKGYARALIRHLVNYHSELTDNHLYLYSNNPVALKIYREIGFVDFPFPVSSWSAWKSGVDELF